MIGLGALPVKPVMKPSGAADTSEQQLPGAMPGTGSMVGTAQLQTTINFQLPSTDIASETKGEADASDFADLMSGEEISLAPNLSPLLAGQPLPATLTSNGSASPSQSLMTGAVPTQLPSGPDLQIVATAPLGEQAKPAVGTERPSSDVAIAPPPGRPDANARVDTGSAAIVSGSTPRSDLSISRSPGTPTALSAPTDESAPAAPVGQSGIIKSGGELSAVKSVVESPKLMPPRVSAELPPQPHTAIPAPQTNAMKPARNGTPSPDLMAPPAAPKQLGTFEIDPALKSDRIEASWLPSQIGRSGGDLASGVMLPFRTQTLGPDRAVGQSIASQVAFAVTRTGSETVEIRLDPPELGQVRIALTSGGDTIAAQLLTDRPETGDLMRRHSDLLHRELNLSGFKSVSLDFGSTGHEPGQETAQGAPQGTGEIELSLEDEGSTRLSRGATSASGLNLRL